jgi:hypothetical protein
MKRVGYILAAVGLALAAFAPRAEAAAKQMQITFGGYTNRSEVLTNFPVLVVLSNGVGGNFTFADFVTTNGYDLRFYTDPTDIGAGLNYEIESWNTNAGQASYVWVQVPAMPTNGLGSIYAKWGDSANSNQLVCTTNGAVWTNGYIGVWHMAMTNAAGLIPDSSASPHHGTNYSTTVTTGMVGYGRSLNGSACIDVTGVTRAAGPVTFEYWLRTSSSATPLFLTDCELGRLVTGINSTTAGKVSYYDGTWQAEVGSGLNNGVWHHVVFSLRSGNGTISVDGSVGGTGITYTETAIGGAVIIGGRYSRDLYRLTGDLDEVRISTVARSSNWVWACYLNQASNTVFNNYGAMTAAAAPGTLIIANRPVTSLTTNSATFNGTLTSTGSSACAVCVYWGADTNAWANTNWFNGGAVNVDWTNNTPFSTNIIGLSPMTTYYYTYGASNATTNVVASGPVSLTTISLPSVTNLGAQTRRTWARLGGQVLTTGGDTPTCWFAWWQNGFATTTTVSMGTQSGVFSTELSTLAAGTTYGCLVTASNSAGVVTSEARSFTTLGSGPVAWYAATNGTDGAGSNWSTAITNLQTVLDTARSNDTIYVAGHAFGLTTQLVWTTSYVTVRGGYAATNAADQPGPNNPALWPTVIRRASGDTRLLYVKGVTNGTLEQVTLREGYVTTTEAPAVRVEASVGLVLSSCIVENNICDYIVNSYSAHAAIYASANTSMTLTNCIVRNNEGKNMNTSSWTGYGGGVHSCGSLTVVDSQILNNLVRSTGAAGCGGGIYFDGTSLMLRNVLLAGNEGRTYGTTLGIGGLYVANGSADIRNVTVADNFGIGLQRAGGTVALTNCVVWYNSLNTSGTVATSYSLIGVDPKFEYGYYLGAGSPATNAGSDMAANLGLQNYAKNAAGATYGAGETVNMGYHYKTGADQTYADLYVAPAPLGADTNSGTNAAVPFKTMTKALTTALDGTRIHVASGTYATNSGETFPLALGGKAGVKILGTNATATVFDASGANQRVFAVTNRANRISFESVTLRGGNVTGSEGSALRIENSTETVLSGCIVESNTCTYSVNSDVAHAAIYGAAATSVTLTNCIVRNNEGINWITASRPAYGGGIYSIGSLTLVESIIQNNLLRARYEAGYGAGIYFGGSTLTMRNVLMAGNEGRAYGTIAGVGGLYMVAGSADLRNVTVANSVGGMGVKRVAGTVTVKDSILWGNGVDSTGGVTLAWSCYSNSTDHVNGGNNTNANPLFVDTTYYHLKSRGGNYVGGYFSGGTWANASESSPCIDAGDPTSDYSREPEPNGRQVNLGAYGNTPVASKKLSGGMVLMIL